MPGRGRPRNPRRVGVEPTVTYFKPRGVPLSELEVAVLTMEELEAMRLVDQEGMEQEAAASIMGISRRALRDDLVSGRRKIIGALVSGKAVEIRGGSYVLQGKRRFACFDCQGSWEEDFGTGRPGACPSCGGQSFRRQDLDHVRPLEEEGE